MSDLTDPFDATVVRPSIPRDHLEPSLGERVNKAIQRSDCISEQNALLRKIVGMYMKRDGKRIEHVGFMELVGSDPASVKPNGSGGYELRRES